MKKNWNYSDLLLLISKDIRKDSIKYIDRNCIALVLDNGIYRQCSRKKKQDNICGLHFNKKIKHGHIDTIDINNVKNTIDIQNNHVSCTQLSDNVSILNTHDVSNPKTSYIEDTFFQNNVGFLKSIVINGTNYYLDTCTNKLFMEDFDEYIKLDDIC